jgi:uncharacterized integral membrane protein (TIGR00698 family)
VLIDRGEAAPRPYDTALPRAVAGGALTPSPVSLRASETAPPRPKGAAPHRTDVAPDVTEVAPDVMDVAPGVMDVAPGVTDAAPGVTDAAPGVTDAAAPAGYAVRCGAWIRQMLPGLAAAGAATAAAWGAHQLVPVLSSLTVAVVLGILASNLRLLPAATGPGVRFATKRLMRVGIALLGLKLVFGDVLALGWQTLAMVVVVVAATFFGTQWLGRKMGLPGDQPLLIATGFSICGASAVAAMNSVTDSEEKDVVTAVAMVTLCGTLAIGILPLLQHPLGLTGVEFGRWVGASVHDVGQVVAAAQTAGPAALTQAVVVKLMRVALLAPLVAAMAIALRRRCATRTAQSAAESAAQSAAGSAAQSAEGSAAESAAPAKGRRVRAARPPLVPLFVVCFLVMAAARSTGWLPDPVVDHLLQVDELLLAAGLFGLGAAVDVRRLVRTGGRALVLGLASWLIVAGVSYAGVLLTT